MAEKLLLHLQYECSRHKIELPWDSIAHRLHPGSTGAAVSQHLGRLRRELTAEGHLVPPMLQRPGISGAVDPDIRGFVRKDDEGENKFATRPVRFSEKHDDRRFNLPDAFDIQDQLPNASFEEEVESDGEDLPESPTPQRRSSRVPTGGPCQYTEQSSPTQDDQDYETNEFEDSAFAVQYNDMDIDVSGLLVTNDRTLIKSRVTARARLKMRTSSPAQQPADTIMSSTPTSKPMLTLPCTLISTPSIKSAPRKLPLSLFPCRAPLQCNCPNLTMPRHYQSPSCR